MIESEHLKYRNASQSQIMWLTLFFLISQFKAVTIHKIVERCTEYDHSWSSMLVIYSYR